MNWYKWKINLRSKLEGSKNKNHWVPTLEAPILGSIDSFFIICTLNTDDYLYAGMAEYYATPQVSFLFLQKSYSIKMLGDLQFDIF